MQMVLLINKMTMNKVNIFFILTMHVMLYNKEYKNYKKVIVNK